MPGIALIAFGGNALVREDQAGTQQQQMENAAAMARVLAPLVRRGHQLVLVHGNGPQVGQILIQAEEAVTKVPPMSLDVCVSQSEGSIGYLLECALRNEFRRQEITQEVACILTLVLVDPDDPAFRDPTKPIGPFYTRYRAEELQERHAWRMVEDSGRGWRKVVASPRPLGILSLPLIRSAVDRGHLVIAAGGGGIPVCRDGEGALRGIEAVIDKDYTAGLLARDLAADRFLILTRVDRVAIDYGTPRQKEIDRLSCAEAEALLREGQFPPGSMGPKVRAGVEFSRATGRESIITSVARLPEAITGAAGTRITP
ncbi:MAG: carbamate kinase [Acidobacteria bacterium]|nr:carbamate kinase [Acidobacteriota bacterium]